MLPLRVTDLKQYIYCPRIVLARGSFIDNATVSPVTPMNRGLKAHLSAAPFAQCELVSPVTPMNRGLKDFQVNNDPARQVQFHRLPR